MRAPAWQRRLDRAGMQLRPLPAEAGSWGVFQNGDRRKRPLARISETILRAARADGVIEAIGEDAYVLRRHTETFRARATGDFRKQHNVEGRRNFVESDGKITNREVDYSDSPLSRWIKVDKRSGEAFLTQEEFEAGERLRADYHRSVLSDRVTLNWDSLAANARSSSGRAREDAPASAHDAKERVLAALKAVGCGLDQVLSAICLREVGMEQAEQENGWTRRAGKTLLKIALQRLAVHYGLMRKSEAMVSLPGPHA